MTKPIYIAAAVVLAFSMSACGQDEDANVAPMGPTSSTNTNTGGPSSPTGGPLVTGETGTSSSSSAVGGTSGTGASGTEAGGSSMSPNSNTSGAPDSSTLYGTDAEKSKR